MLLTLNAQEVLAIHYALAADFAAAEDPISPAGLRSEDLLESAVSRQFTGHGNRLKYDGAVANAASLTYGICSNHPFFNGNKRTSLVSMLCHLDKNDLTFKDNVTHDDLYDFILKVARHGFSDGKARDRSDHEVDEMGKWIRKRTRRVEDGERIVTYRELKSILANFGFLTDALHDNSCDLVYYDQGLLGKRRVRVMRIGYPGDGVVVGRGQLTDIRKRCRLTKDDGVDSKGFYAKERRPDYFISTYRGILRRLARI